MRPSLPLLIVPLLLGGLSGCGALFGEHKTLFDGYTLVFGLAQSETVAGAPVGYTAWLIDGADQPVPGVTWEITSDLQGRVEFGLDRLVATAAGDHTLTATVEHEGHTFVSTAPLAVVPDAPYSLDLRLSDRSLPAGESLTWEVALVDAWGNDLDATGADVWVSDPQDVTLGPSTVTSTLPGMYLVEASWDGFHDVESFVVVPGPPVGVSLALSRTTLDLWQTASANVEVWDAYGNLTQDPWTVTTDRPASTVVSHRNVTFLQEGWHTVHVTVDGTALTDSVGPFLIDSSSPKIVITTPERGAWRTTPTTTVSGNAWDEWSAVTDLTVNGVPVVPDSQGNFSTNASLDVGTTVIETWASDAEGNASQDVRAVLRGAFRSYGQNIPRGIQVRIQEGAGGIDTLEAIGEGLIASQDLGALIPNPIASGHSQSCTFLGCISWYRYRLRILNPSIGSTKLDLDPLSNGQLRIDFRVNNPRLTWVADQLRALGINISSQSGSITANYIHVTAITAPWVQGTTIRVPVTSTSVSISNLQFNWNSVIWDILSFFGVNSWINSAISSYMQNAIRDAVRTEVPPAVEGALQDLELDYPIGLQGRTYSFRARPAAIAIDNLGINLDLGTTVTVDQSTHPGWLGHGSLYNNWPAPSYTSWGPKMNVSFSGDLVNQLFYVVWRGGLLDFTTSSDALGLPASDLALLLPNVSQLTVKVDPLLPPVVMPITSGLDQMELQIGDLELTLFNGAPANNDILIRAYVTAYAPLRLGAVGDQSLTATIGDPDIYFDVVVPESHTMGASDTEALLHAIVPLILPVLADAISEIDIPEIQGFGISGISVTRTGVGGGFVKLGGSLYQQ